MLYRVHLTWAIFELTTLVVIGTDCIGSCNSNYHTIATTTAPNDDKTINLLANNNPQDEDGELTQNRVINNPDNNRNTHGKLELSEYIFDVQHEADQRPAITTKNMGLHIIIMLPVWPFVG